MKYYIAENGQPAGPFEPNELLAHGLTINSLVWAEGMANWMSAGQVPELMAILSGTPYTPGGGGIDMQLPPVAPPSQLPQTPPFGTGQQQPTTYGQPNQPYAPPQYGPSNQQQSRIMPKTWLTESVLVTVLSLLCLCNFIGIIPGIIAIFKANSVKTKFMRGDTAGAEAASASAKKWVLITVIVMVVWSVISGIRLMSDNGLWQQIQEGSIGSLYSF